MPLRLKESDLPSLTSKTALVTGGTSGLGLQTAILLATHGATVHIASRNAAKGHETVASLRTQYPSHTYHYHPLDLSSIANATESAALFARENTHLDILIANAGVACVPVDELSVDGLDMAFAVNHVGHFVFISGLLPLLRRTAEQSGDVRIVITSSYAYKFVDRVDLSDIGRRVPGDGESIRHLPAAIRRYGRSKRANILFAMELDRRLRAPDELGVCMGEGVRVNVCHPGTIANTGLGDYGAFSMPAWTTGLVRNLIGIVGITPREGAMTQTLLATAEKIREEDVHGSFFAPKAGWNMRYMHSEEVDPGEWARSEEDAKALWEWTEGWVDKVLGKGNPGGE